MDNSRGRLSHIFIGPGAAGINVCKERKQAKFCFPAKERLMTTPNRVKLVIYDAPAVSASSCACGCGGHHHGEIADPLDSVSLEWQARALALTLEAAFPGQVEVEYINVLKDPRGKNLPQTAPVAPGHPRPGVSMGGALQRPAVGIRRNEEGQIRLLG
jgi:hypothetical protein